MIHLVTMPVIERVMSLCVPRRAICSDPLGLYCVVCGVPLGSKDTVLAVDEVGVKYEIHCDCLPSHLRLAKVRVTGQCPECGFKLRLECDLTIESQSGAQKEFLRRHASYSPKCTGCAQ